MADAKDNKKEQRRGGKGGRGYGAKDGDGERKGKGEGGKGGKPRKPREELPMVEDPQAELDKLMAEPMPKKPDRDALEHKIGNIQNDIDSNKRRTEQITKDLDAIKEKNERLKKSGASGMEACREKLREFKKQIVGVIEERKHISSSIDEIRAKKNEMEESLKKQRAAVGRFSSNDSIDEEIKRIEEYMAHNSLNIKQEKEYMAEIKALNKKRDEVKQLEIMEGKRGAGASKMSLPELFEARKKVDEKLNGLREQEKTAVEELNALREKGQSKDSDRFQKLLDERKEIREKISELISSIRDMRSEHGEMDDKWYNRDRLEKNLKWQIRQKNLKEREARKKEWEEKHAGEPDPEDEEDEEGNKKPKEIDWDLAERIMLCEQLIVFLEGYLPKEAAAVETKSAVKIEGAYTKESQSGKLEEDALGLNAFMVYEVVSKQSKKKNKKKNKNAAKNDVQAALAEEGSIPLALTLDMMQNFTSMALPVPVSSDDAAPTIEKLKAKKAYYETEGEAGHTLKEVIKKEKSERKKESGGAKEEKKEGKKKGSPKSSPKNSPKLAPKPDPLDAAVEAAAAKEEEKKTAAPDWNAEKIARKLAAAPDHGMSAEELAAMRAKAKGGGMTDEEKKARGLLYDTSKARAVREESSDDSDDEAADFDGGDPFDGL